MKKVVFVRHGKAEELQPEITDFERSLTLKGKAVSMKMAFKLMEKENDPGILITSPAFRAFETALIFNNVFKLPPEKIRINSNIYFKLDKNTFFEILKEIPEETEIITLFGHNPSFTELPEQFCTEGLEPLPKSGIICLSFKSKTWSGISLNSGFIEYFLKPKKVL
jgi:phosphohistidine phosphatase